MSSSNLVRVTFAKETTYGTIPTAVYSTVVIQDLTFTAVLAGTGQDAISIEYTNTGTAGAETVVVTGNAIVIDIQSGTSTATQVKAAFDGSAAAIALAACTISGTAGTAQTTQGPTNLATGAGGFSTSRFTSEALSGTPDTVESAQIRVDRLSSGQVVTGLTVGGAINFELAKEAAIDSMLESALFNTFVSTAAVVVGLTLDSTLKTITRAAGSFVTEGLVIGDIIVLSGGTANNNVEVVVLDVTALVVTYQGPAGMTNDTPTGYQLADKLEVGINKQSFSMEKTFLDLTTKAINYSGMIVSEMELNVAYGELVTGSFTFSGNGYEAVEAAADFNTYLREITDPATSNSMNGSIDMPFLVTSADGTLGDDDFCIQNISLSLNNNLTPQNCIGLAAPQSYSEGTAQIGVSLSTYLKDAAWQLLGKKLSQEAFGLGFIVKNTGGWYGFYMPAVQVSFDDPASGGQNQDVILEMEGTAKVGVNGEKSIYIYKLG
jgi:hypothetical protein